MRLAIIEDDHLLSDANNRSAFTGLAGYGALISIGENDGSGEIQIIFRIPPLKTRLIQAALVVFPSSPPAVPYSTTW